MDSSSTPVLPALHPLTGSDAMSTTLDGGVAASFSRAFSSSASANPNHHNTSPNTSPNALNGPQGTNPGPGATFKAPDGTNGTNNDGLAHAVSASAHISKPARPRTQMACDYCRKKKTRCNGQKPCQNCPDLAQCVYSAHKERKRTAKPYSGTGTSESDSKTIQTLNSRISSLELLLSSLVTKLDGLKTSSSSKSSPESIDAGSPESPLNSSSAAPPGATNTLQQFKEIVTVHSKPKKLSKLSNIWLKRKPTENHIRSRSHSYFCIISEKSLNWIKRRLKPQDLKIFFSMEKLPLLLNATDASLAKVWVNVPKELKRDITPYFCAEAFPSEFIGVSTGKNLCDFPKDPNLVYGLIKAYYKSVFTANFLVDYDVVLKLFQRHYECEEGSKPIFKYSELLVMNIALAIAIENKGSVWSKFTEIYTMQDLLKLQQDCFNNCVYFYERIHVVSEGLITIQAILLLATYTETRYPTDFYINNMLCSVAIRFAQEVGLHRIEAFHGLSSEITAISKRVWWYCQCLDMDTCFKTGKPPLINLSDVSTLTEVDELCPFATPENKHYTTSELIDICKSEQEMSGTPSAYIIYCHYWLAINRIRNESYYELFSAASQRKLASFLDQKQVDAINKMNKQMYELIEQMDPLLRPDIKCPKSTPSSKEQSKFSSFYLNNEDFLYEMSVLFKSLFYNHMMIINRVPILVLNPDNIVELECEQLSMECARNQLELLRQVDCNRISKFQYNNLQQSGFVAYLTIISKYLRNPTSKDIGIDFPILAKYSLEVVSRGTDNYTKEDWRRLRILDNRSLIMMLIVRMTLRVLVAAVESETSLNFMENQPALAMHLAACEDMYPEVFAEAEEKMNGLGLQCPTTEVKLRGDSVITASSSRWKINPSATQHSYDHYANSGNGNVPSNSSNHSSNSSTEISPSGPTTGSIRPSTRSTGPYLNSFSNIAPSFDSPGADHNGIFAPLDGMQAVENQHEQPLQQHQQYQQQQQFQQLQQHQNQQGQQPFSADPFGQTFGNMEGQTDGQDSMAIEQNLLNDLFADSSANTPNMGLFNTPNSFNQVFNMDSNAGYQDSDFMDVDAISNLLFTQAYNFPSIFEGVS